MVSLFPGQHPGFTIELPTLFFGTRFALQLSSPTYSLFPPTPTRPFFPELLQGRHSLKFFVPYVFSSFLGFSLSPSLQSLQHQAAWSHSVTFFFLSLVFFPVISTLCPGLSGRVPFFPFLFLTFCLPPNPQLSGRWAPSLFPQ